MKITKRQLRRIIAEEKQKLLNESVTDMSAYDNMYTTISEGFAYQIAERFARQFADDMDSLYLENPEEIRGSREEWASATDYATEVIYDDIASQVADPIRAVIKPIVEDVIETIEAQLHDGAFDLER